MRPNAPLVVVALAAGALLASQGAFAQGNPRLGTWKLDVSKSKYEPGPPPKSETRTYAASDGDAVTLSAETVAADGTKQSSSYTAKYDGKDYPFHSTIGDTIAIKAVDAYTITANVKKAGKVVQTTRSVVSKDGKTLTMTTKGVGPDGKPLSNTRIYHRQ